MTADDLSTRVLRALNVIAVGETPTANQLLICFEALNDLIDAWKIERLMVYARLRTTKALTSGTASYTIGTDGDVDIERPTEIEDAGLILDNTADPVTEVPIAVFSEQDWAGISQKDLAGSRLRGVFYDHAWTAGLGTIYPWPVPDVSTETLVLYTPAPVDEFADQATTDYTFAPAYRRALRWNLKVEVANDFDKEPTALDIRQAAKAKQLIQRSNVRPRRLRFDGAMPGVRPRRGDIRSGGY